jgi:hypothetical protein
LVVLGTILGFCGLVESNLNQFGWLSEASLPRIGTTSAQDLMKVPPGWRMVGSEPLDGWQPLFGPASISKLLVLQGPEKPLVFVQAVLSRDLGDFTTYGVEQCYLFHGYTLQTVQHISLGNGVTAALVDFQVASGSRAVSLYWIQPVQTPSGLYHERIVVGTDVEAFQAMSSLHIPRAGVASPIVAKLGDSLIDFFSPWGSANVAPPFRLANRYVEWLSQSVIAQERTR